MPAQPPREVDDDRRGDPPDPVPLPVDLVIGALRAFPFDHCRPVVGGIEHEVEPAPRTTAPLRSGWGRSRGRAGRSPSTGVISKPECGAIDVARADHAARRAGGCPAPPMPRAAPPRPASRPDRCLPPGKAIWPGMRAHVGGAVEQQDAGRRARSVMATSTAAGRKSVDAFEPLVAEQLGRLAVRGPPRTAPARRGRTARSCRHQREGRALAGARDRSSPCERDFDQLRIGAAVEPRLGAVAHGQSRSRASRDRRATRIGWSGPAMTRSSVLSRKASASPSRLARRSAMKAASSTSIASFSCGVTSQCWPSASRSSSEAKARTIAGRVISPPSWNQRPSAAIRIWLSPVRVGRPALDRRQLARRDQLGDLGERQRGEFGGRLVGHRRIAMPDRLSAAPRPQHALSGQHAPGCRSAPAGGAGSHGPGSRQPPVCAAEKPQKRP